MTTLPLPPLVGTRNRARALTDELPEDLRGSTVVVDGSNLLASTSSFVDELVKQILVSRDAAFLHVTNVHDEEFVRWLQDRAAANGVGGRVRISHPDGEQRIIELP